MPGCTGEVAGAVRSYVLGALGNQCPDHAVVIEDRGGWAAVHLVDPDAALPGEQRPVPEAALVTWWTGAQSGAGMRRFLRRIRPEIGDDAILILHLEAASAGAPLVLARDVVPALRGAGFAVERVDSDLIPGLPPSAVSVSVQAIARPIRMPPRSLAVASWRTPSRVRLDLRYAPDEASLLDPAPSQVWEELIAQVRGGADLVASYPVDDPYGGERGADVVGRHFGCPVGPENLTFGAGVTSLLQSLSELADGGVVAAPELVHADLEAWAAARGRDVVAIGEPATPERLVAALEEIRPALLHLDRPTFTGQLLGLDELELILTGAARVGCLVVIDESAAPYAGPAASAVVAAHRVPNLVVLRGFTKAYSWGGLRGGFAVSSSDVAGRVRELVPPLQVGELALRAALQLLDLGDVFGRLRERIRECKPVVAGMLAALGLEVLDGHRDLPWIAISDAGGAASRLFDDCGIAALFPPPWPMPQRAAPSVLRITVPLSEHRLALLRRLLAGAGWRQGRQREMGSDAPALQTSRTSRTNRNGGSGE
jgi:histidinol-phosphate aminotransferase